MELQAILRIGAWRVSAASGEIYRNGMELQAILRIGAWRVSAASGEIYRNGK
jgi:hypothetical protein